MPTPYQLDDLLALPPGPSRERATWVYGALRYFLDVPTASRTDRLQQFTAEVDAHPHAQEIRDIFHDFWSHHSYIRVISEAGLPDQVFLLRELLARTLRHLMPVDEVQGDLYVLLDSLNLREADAQWIASVPDSLAGWWAEIFRPSQTSILASCELLALRATNVALARDFLTLSDDADVTNSPFFTLPALVEHVVQNQGQIFVVVAIGGDIAAAGLEAHLDAQFAALANGGDGQVAIQHFDIWASVSIWPLSTWPGLCDAQARDPNWPSPLILNGTCLRLRMMSVASSTTPGDGTELVGHAFDADGGDGGAFDGAEQHPA